MKWYQDLLVWFVILLALFSVVVVGFHYGSVYVIDNCKNYRAHKISDKEAMLCIVVPVLPNNSGEKAYLPDAKATFKGKTT